MNNIIETIKYKNFDIEINQDIDSQNPRKEFDNLGTMIFFHKRYNLGDETNLNSNDFNNWHEVEKYIIKNYNPFVLLPVYMYDHSGITISCSLTYPYNDKWDSCQIGFIFVEKEKIKKEYEYKKLTKKRKEQIKKYLLNEVKIYDDYLTGNVYGYSINDNEDNFIDSCYGFYGYNFKENGLLEQAKNSIDCHIESKRKEHFEQLKKWIKGKVNIEYRKSCPI